MNEYRFAELRAEPGTRVLEGTAVRYGDIASLPWGKEKFMSGAFGQIGDVILNRQHSRDRPVARTGGGGMVLTDNGDSLRMVASLPETRDADDALALVRAGVLRGLSTEFLVEAERFEGSMRIIDRAKLVGLAIVDSPAYPSSLIQAREKALQAVSAPPRRVIF